MKFSSERDRIDARFLRGLQIRAQELGGTNGVPLAVFHRLHAAGKVFINSNGLVEAHNGETK